MWASESKAKLLDAPSGEQRAWAATLVEEMVGDRIRARIEWDQVEERDGAGTRNDVVAALVSRWRQSWKPPSLYARTYHSTDGKKSRVVLSSGPPDPIFGFETPHVKPKGVTLNAWRVMNMMNRDVSRKGKVMSLRPSKKKDSRVSRFEHVLNVGMHATKRSRNEMEGGEGSNRGQMEGREGTFTRGEATEGGNVIMNLDEGDRLTGYDYEQMVKVIDRKLENAFNIWAAVVANPLLEGIQLNGNHFTWNMSPTKCGCDRKTYQFKTRVPLKKSKKVNAEKKLRAMYAADPALFYTIVIGCMSAGKLTPLHEIPE